MSINWFPGHMAKARRQIEEVLKKIDVVIEILDARIPVSSHNPMLDEVVKNKPRIILLNKKDLADPNETSKWIAHFKRQGHQVLALNGRESHLIKKIEPLAEIATQDYFDKQAAKGINKRAIRAMIFGIPNVGKSTIINNIAGKKQAITGNTPGVTKKQQWIKAGRDMELLDTPGILWPKFEDEETGQKLSLTGAIKDAVVPLDEVAIYALHYLQTHDLERMNKFYNIDVDAHTDTIEIFDAIGASRGFKMRGNLIDYEQVTNRVIYDVRNGKVGAYSFDKVENYAHD